MITCCFQLQAITGTIDMHHYGLDYTRLWLGCQLNPFWFNQQIEVDMMAKNIIFLPGATIALEKKEKFNIILLYAFLIFSKWLIV